MEIKMNKTIDNTKINIMEENNSFESLTTMDFNNTFDYLNEYYVDSFEYCNSFDYLSEDDSENDIDYNVNKSKGCKVISIDDSIHIVHEGGEKKHIKKKDYQCASDKYNKNKKKKKETSTSNTNSCIPSIPSLSSLNTTTKKASSGGCLKLIILFFIFGPCILPIILGIIQGILEVLLDIIS